ncbi:hypothetical protein [Halogeometricum borinquense]|uniref:hypothetical protein n=1 Tax=Halogeometricum borinquense TaxID=60847 RepID=UPI00343781FB
MEFKIIGEDKTDIGVKVDDNNGISHQIEFHKSNAEIYAHTQDCYPDNPAKRSDLENEMCNQARKYAKWCVYKERGYETLTRYENPDSIASGLLAILDLSDAELAEYFGDLQQQLRSHFDGSTGRLLSDNIDLEEDTIIYQKDVYIEPDPTGRKPLLVEQLADRWGNPKETAIEILRHSPERSLLEFDIVNVSELYYRHDDGFGNSETHRSDQPRNRDPDARIELLPIDPDQFESFQFYLVSHLVYQIRDCYLSMGCTPPKPFRSTGRGKYDELLKQLVTDVYEEYHSPDATISSWDPGQQ